MSSISGVSGMSNAWAYVNTQRSSMQARLFSQVDTDSSGSVNQAELGSLLSDLSELTGTTLDAEELFTSMDTDSDGSLSSDELAAGVEGLLQASSSTVDFASQRNELSGADHLFSKVDKNADGAVDEAEMTAFTNKMRSETGLESPTSFDELDTNKDGELSPTEFRAGEASGPPPLNPPERPLDASSTSASATQSYDPLDTNQDGTVSELERLAGALKDLVSASENAESTSKISENILALAKLMYEQISSGLSNTSGSTLSTSA